MFVAIVTAGSYISSIVTRTAIDHTAAASALLVDSMLMPHVELLANEAELSPTAIAALDELVSGDVFQQRFPHIDIWRPDGTVVYSRSDALIGMTFSPPAGLDEALDGSVAARFTDLSASEHVAREFDEPFLEIYVPIREHQSGRIIAVAEIHEDTAPINSQLFNLRTQTWLMVVFVAALIMLGLFWIVHRGARLIETQKAELRDHIARIEQVSRQNRALRERAQNASGRVTELTERQLRRIGADLHDGPAQLIGYGVLGLEHIKQAATEVERDAEIGKIQDALNDAMRDIRIISKGLLGPDIAHLTLDEVIQKVCDIHEQRTATQVQISRSGLHHPFSEAIKICVYRFLQEGLNNAFRHAGGQRQSVACGLEGGLLRVSVESKGCEEDARNSGEPGLGLVGLRQRVESLGGTFTFTHAPDGGTRMEMVVIMSGH
jgi:signal transduction histidine kinase